MGLAVKIAAGVAALSMTVSSPAVAAARAEAAQASLISPWVALTALAPNSSGAGLCASGLAAASSASQTGVPGCVLPQVDAPAPVAQTAPAPAAVLLPGAGVSGIGFVPILLGLAALAAGVALLAGSGKDNGVSARPISPA